MLAGGARALQFCVQFKIVLAHEVSFENQAHIFNRAFAGYLVKFPDMDAAGVAQFIRAQGVDLCYSRFARQNGQIAGFGCINRTGNISRLAGMGVVPEVRRTGAANFLLSTLIDEARSRSDTAMVLEVFEQNGPALALYRQSNFREVMRLFGWHRQPKSIENNVAGNLEEISLIEAAHDPVTIDFPDIPWQFSRHAVAKLPLARAFRLENVCAIISDPNVSPTRIFALLGYEETNPTAMRKVVAALLQRFPKNEFLVRQTFPEHLSEVFDSLGFVREPLNQFLMRLDLV
jgi:ribosomal protein S18 acetylase RimI-like enzyme